jgi:tripartite-type tricarboxylate transporter receptor subunit TctC
MKIPPCPQDRDRAARPRRQCPRKSMSEKDLIELIARLKANPNRASMGAVTGASHLLSAFLQKETGTQFALVPYRGVPPAMQDLASGQIDLAFSTTASMPLVRPS